MSDTTVVAEWYNHNVALEHNRLIDGQLEYTIILRTILDSLPKDNATTCLRIADIGGGTGRYALELTKLGHKVTLVDISQKELDRASQLAKAENVTFEAVLCADASNLRETPPLPQEQAFGAVLLLGPLYHLLERDERVATLSACAAMTKPNGLVFASFVTKLGHLRTMAERDPARLAREESFYREYLASGKYTRSRDIFMHHTHPTEIRELFGALTEPELRVERLVACESFLGSGPAAGLNGLDEESYQAWEKVLLHFAEDEHVLGASDHILAVARRVHGSM